MLAGSGPVTLFGWEIVSLRDGRPYHLPVQSIHERIPVNYDRFELPREPEDQLPVVHRWQGERAPAGVVVIAHGMGEHALRYARFAEALVAAGFVVYANDHAGHGATVRTADQLGDFGVAGWRGLVDDLRDVILRARADHPEQPIVLFGHSMGSMAVQHLLTETSELVDAAALSGTTAVDLMAATTPDPDVDLFEVMNGAFAPNRTDFDWLSRDEAEVDRYVADPLCGFTAHAESTSSLGESGIEFSKPERIATIRKNLPIYLIAGDKDPVGGNGALVELVAQRYREAGIVRVDMKLYADARHEVLNETNREEVTADFVRWAQSALGQIA